MVTGLLSEVAFSNGHICMRPSVFANTRDLLLANIGAREAAVVLKEKKLGTAMCFGADGQHMLQDYVGDADVIRYWTNLKPEDRVINVVYLDGPMTREGGACSYGTMQLRDKIMRAADCAQCRGHIIHCNTPGGMAQSLQDIRLAINYAHQKGQSVYMLIDGQCASGGAFTSAICDKVFFVNPKDEIGSIGMYCAFFTLADGAKNSISSETYHEYYATASKDKNAWYRKAADGDMSAVEKDVEADLAQLIANLKADRPSIKDDQCTGKMYAMRDVIGTLVDGQSTLPGVAQMLLDDWEARQGAALPLKGEVEPVADPIDEPNPDNEPNPTDDDDNDNGDNPPSDEVNTNSNTKTSMKQYTAISTALGLESVMETLDGADLSLNPELAAALEQQLFQAQSRETNFASQITALTQLLADAEASHTAAIDALKVEHNTAIENLNKEHTAAMTQADEAHKQALADAETAHNTAIEDLNKTHEAALADLKTQHQTAIDGLNTQLADANNKVTDLTQRNTDLKSQVEDLQQAQGAAPQAGAQPQTNGMQAPQQPQIIPASVYDPTLSAEENARRILEARGKK